MEGRIDVRGRRNDPLDDYNTHSAHQICTFQINENHI